MELQAKSLMIGDWIKITDGNKKCTVVGVKCDARYLEEEAIITVMDDSGHWFDKELECLQPIPLTPELLEKKGFERVPQSGCTNPYHWMLEKYEEESEGLLYRIKAYNTPFRGMYVSVDNYADCKTINFSKQIEHFHELQHALKLCGIEKTIEL